MVLRRILVVADGFVLSPTVGMFAVLVGGVGGLWLGRELRARSYAARAAGATPSA